MRISDEEYHFTIEMINTVPSTDGINFKLTGYNKDSLTKWHRLIIGRKTVAPIQMKYGFSPAAGIMSSVADLKYSIATMKKFLKPEHKEVFTPYVTERKTIQYGLGWFVKDYKGLKLYGIPVGGMVIQHYT